MSVRTGKRPEQKESVMLKEWTWEKQIAANESYSAKQREQHFRKADIDSAWKQHKESAK